MKICQSISKLFSVTNQGQFYVKWHFLKERPNSEPKRAFATFLLHGVDFCWTKNLAMVKRELKSLRYFDSRNQSVFSYSANVWKTFFDTNIQHTCGISINKLLNIAESTSLNSQNIVKTFQEFLWKNFELWWKIEKFYNC